MKKIGLVVVTMGMIFGSLVAFSNDSKAAEINVNETASNYGVIFKEGFNNGLTGWAKDGDVRVEQKSGNKYILLAGVEDCSPIGGGCYPQLSIIQRTLAGYTPGKTYKFSIRAIGIGKMAVNSSDYQIAVDDGNASLDIDNSKTYSTSFKANNNGHVTVTILAYGTRMLVDDIKIED